MIVYARGRRGYKLWDIAAGKVVVSRDVRFDELNETVQAPGAADPSESPETPPFPINEEGDEE